MSDVRDKVAEKVVPTRVYVWRNLERGVLIVTAESLAEARAVVVEKHATWATYTRTHEPVQVVLARVGELAVLPMRR